MIYSLRIHKTLNNYIEVIVVDINGKQIEQGNVCIAAYTYNNIRKEDFLCIP